MRRKLKLAALVFAFTVVVPVSIASADTVSGIAQAKQDSDRIDKFVELVRSTWGYDLNPADYIVESDAKGTLVKGREASLQVVQKQVQTARGVETSSVVRGEFPLPTVEEGRAMVKEGKFTIEQEALWYQPACGAFTSNNGRDGEPVGSETFCQGWGEMGYEGNTLRNVAFRQNNTCIADHGPFNRNYELTDCGVRTYANSTPWVWNGFEPKSDIEQPGCAQKSFAVAAGPVSASMAFNLCDFNNMEVDGNAAPSHLSQWLGEKQGRQREAGKVVSIGVLHSYPGATIVPEVGYNYHECGSLAEFCD